MQAIGPDTRYRNASNDLQQRWVQHDKYTLNELDDIYFTKPQSEIQRDKAQGISQRQQSPICGSDGARFKSKTDFLKSLNELLTYTAPQNGLRSKYNHLIRKGQKQEFVDLSLLKKMDGHLDWAMKRNDNRTDLKQEDADRQVDLLIAQQKKNETQAEINGKLMKKRIQNLLNKKVAGRAEGIDKVESFLEKQERFEVEEAKREAQIREQKIANLNRLAAEREAKRNEELELFSRSRRTSERRTSEADQSEPETPIYLKIKKQHIIKPSNFSIVPVQADYLEKQLKHMKAERFSGLQSFDNRTSALTQASTMNNTINFEDDSDMPFAIANTVKHTHKKSLMLAANNMLSPKSNNAMRLSFRKGSVTFERPPSAQQENMMRATSISFRNKELDNQINQHIKKITSPKVDRARDCCLSSLKDVIQDKVNKQQRSNIFTLDRAQYDQEVEQKNKIRRQTCMMKGTLEAYDLSNKFSDSMKKKRLGDSPLRKMKQLQLENNQPTGTNMLASLFSPKN